jgi:hypothetical protein
MTMNSVCEKFDEGKWSEKITAVNPAPKDGLTSSVVMSLIEKPIKKIFKNFECTDTTHVLSPKGWQRYLRYSFETPTFYQNYLAMMNTADLIGGKAIAVYNIIECTSIIRLLVAVIPIINQIK